MIQDCKLKAVKWRQTHYSEIFSDKKGWEKMEGKTERRNQLVWISNYPAAGRTPTVCDYA
jgi:hypothetical protein